MRRGWSTPKADPKGIDLFFNTFCAGTSRTFFEGIKSIPPGHYLRVRDGRIELKKYWDLDFPDAGDERRLDDPAPLVDELEFLMRQAVERRLRGDVPVVSYISGGLDSTVVLGLSSRQRGYAVPSFTIGLDRAGPDERSHAAESAAALGSELTTVTMNRGDIVAAYPELIRAAEGPVMDSSAACLMRLARAVHAKGYKVVLTGEGADEALAGYAWFKTQKIRNMLSVGPIAELAQGGAEPDPGFDRRRIGAPARIARDQGGRTAQQDVYDFMGQARSLVYTPHMWRLLAGHSAYDDLDLPNDRFARWHPLNQSLYVGYKVMLAGLLLLGKGDRVAMNSSVETRYPLLDDDVISFCASIAPEYKLHGLTDKWLLRQVAARTLPPRIANRPKTMFRASRSDAFLGQGRPAVGRPAPEPRVAPGDGLVRPGGRRPRACRPDALSADHAQADHHGPEPDLRHRHPALAPHLPGRRPVRAAHLGATWPQPLRAAQQPRNRRFPTGSRPTLRPLRPVERVPRLSGCASLDAPDCRCARFCALTMRVPIKASHHDTP